MNKREVKEPDIVFREAGASESAVVWFLLRAGIASDEVVCSGGVLKSMGVGLSRCR